MANENGPGEFVKGVINEQNYQKTENGHNELSVDGFCKKLKEINIENPSVSPSLVAMFDDLVRNRPSEDIERDIYRVIAENNLSDIEDLFALAFHTRWSRGGKGEKELTWIILEVLYDIYPNVILELIIFLPQFGYWKDMMLFLVHCKKKSQYSVAYSNLKSRIWDIFGKQILADHAMNLAAKADGNKPIYSIAAKWAPRQKKRKNKTDKSTSFDLTLNAVSELCKVMFPDVVGVAVLKDKSPEVISSAWRKAQTDYRHIIVSLTDVPETDMCANKFSEIKFDHSTSVFTNRQTCALLDEEKDGTRRHLNNSDRNECREKFLTHIIDKGATGKQLFPHELVTQVYNCKVSTAKEQVINAQWESMREGIQEMIAKRIADQGGTANDSVTYGNVICLSDVSGSMQGVPMMVSIALGILLSEISHPAFRDMVLTFENIPQWHNLKDCTTFADKVRSLTNASWGGNTNFFNAMLAIIKIIESNNLSQDEIPDYLAIVSDMQFDQAERCYDAYDMDPNKCDLSKWDISYNKIEKLFHDIGMKMNDKPFRPPKIIFWNVRAVACKGFPVDSSQKGCALLSGYSPSLMKVVMTGEMDQKETVIDVETGETNIVSVQLTPGQVLWRLLRKETNLKPIYDKLAEMRTELMVKM